MRQVAGEVRMVWGGDASTATLRLLTSAGGLCTADVVTRDDLCGA